METRADILVLTLSTVGYDTAVIGGTMALNSFIRDFGMNNIAKSNRDTIQGNIVSTFQVSSSLMVPLTRLKLTNIRLDVSSVRFLPSPLPSVSAGREL